MNEKYSQLMAKPPDLRGRRIVISMSSIRIVFLAVLLFAANGALNRFGAANGLVWMTASVVAIVWFIQKPRLMSSLLAQNWAILILPLYAIASTVWSASPSVTANDGVQMLFTTIISLRIIDALKTRQIMTAMMIALGTATAASLLNLGIGFLHPVYELNGAFLGIFSQKNNFAKAVFWFAFATTAISLIDRRPLIGILCTLLTFPLTLVALSRTGQVGYIFIVILLLLAALRHLSIQSRIVLPVVLALALLGSAIAYALTGGALIGDFLILMGKNPTLTGRTVIWGLGLSVWQDNILVGIGLNAFWTSPLYADAVAYISSNVDDGLHGFHNVYVEFLVAFGVIGAGYLVWLMILAWIRLVRAFVTTRSLEIAIWLSILSALFVFGGFEDSFSKPRSGHFMLAVMVFSYARKVATKSR